MLITDSKALAAFCNTLKGQPFVTVDTEFLRDKTYYPKLCLIQMAAPDGLPAAIDPLAPGIDLTPVLDILHDESIVKVFHAARQDLEIFHQMTGGRLPHPLFDTQVVAMVCGYGDQAAYNSLVSGICKVKLDKGAQFTDWSRRPLSDRQLSYALDDVTYLRDVYLKLASDLKKKGRVDWVTEEMEFLATPGTYENDPEESWRRIKLRTDKPKALAVLKEACAWREREAQRRDVPRNRVVRDETLADLAVHPPETVDDLAKIRGFTADMARGKLGQGVLEAVKRGLAMPKENCPHLDRGPVFPSELTPALEMLKMLLKINCAEKAVAPKLIASSDDLEALAMDDDADIPALKGWRRTVFGEDALALKHGKIGLALKDGKIHKSFI